ncbi:MAG: hypothetical protein ACK5O2_16340 [Microthrixaceae bacterium]
MYRVSDNVINTAGWEFFDAAVNWAANVGAGGGSPVPTVNYTRDATDRIVARTATGETEVRYGHTGDGDSPQVTLDANNQVINTSIGLPGGAVLHHTPGTPAPTAGDAVVVVGDKTNLTGLDTAIKSRLEGDGWTVTFETDDDVDTATDDGADLIFVAEPKQTTPAPRLQARSCTPLTEYQQQAAYQTPAQATWMTPGSEPTNAPSNTPRDSNPSSKWEPANTTQSSPDSSKSTPSKAAPTTTTST